MDKDNFIRHTFIMFVATGLISIFNLAYHLVLVRSLSGVEYGILNTLVSLSLFFALPTSPFQTTLTKFLSGYFALGEYGKISYCLRKVSKLLFVLALAILLIFVLFSGQFSRYFHIEKSIYFIFIGILIFLSVLSLIPSSFLQSAQLFEKLAFVGVSSVLFKLIGGLALLYLGWQVTGGLLGYIFLPLMALFLGVIFLKDYYKKSNLFDVKPIPIEIGSIFKYFFPVSLAVFSFVVFVNIDVVLVKRFFLPDEAGYYSVAQIIGKILLFLPGAISIVVFPKSASLSAQNSSSKHLFRKGLILSALLCAIGAFVCIAFPKLVLGILTSKTFPQSISLVPLFAISMSFYALVNFSILYLLSIHKTKFVFPLFALALMQAVTIYLYHPDLKSILYILTAFAIISFGYLYREVSRQ